MVSTLNVERSCCLTCGVGKDYRRAELCLGVDWRLGGGVKRFELETPDMLGRNGTRMKMVPEMSWPAHLTTSRPTIKHRRPRALVGVMN